MTFTSDNTAWMASALSEERFAPYLHECGGDDEAAWRLYTWNIGVSMAFYPLLHFVEITLRNGLHRELSAHFGRGDWWSVVPLSEAGQRLVKHAQEKLSVSRPAANANDLVTKLTFGFWVSLVSRAYDRTLWVPALHRVFPHHRGRRSAVHADLMKVLELRNRVMHYEPIYRRKLETDRATIYKLLEYMSVDLAEAVRSVDQVPHVLRLR